LTAYLEILHGYARLESGGGASIVCVNKTSSKDEMHYLDVVLAERVLLAVDLNDFGDGVGGGDAIMAASSSLCCLCGG